MAERLTRNQENTQKMEPRWVTDPLMVNKMIELADLRGHERVIDVGTGSGTLLDDLSPYLNNGGTIVGFDISEENLARRDASLPTNAARIQTDLYNPGLQEGIADLVILRQTLHHLEDKSGAVEIASRLATPTGRLIFCEITPPTKEVQEIEREIFGAPKGQWTGEEFHEEVADLFLATHPHGSIAVSQVTLPKYSLRDFVYLAPAKRQGELVSKYKAAPSLLHKTMTASSTKDDIFLDRQFTFLVARK